MRFLVSPNCSHGFGSSPPTAEPQELLPWLQSRGLGEEALDTLRAAKVGGEMRLGGWRVGLGLVVGWVEGGSGSVEPQSKPVQMKVSEG